SLERGDLATRGASFAPALQQLRVSPQQSYLDLRSGRWGTLLPALPLIPGSGVGNSLRWDAMGVAHPTTDSGYGDAALKALSAYISAHDAQLSIDVRELGQ